MKINKYNNFKNISGVVIRELRLESGFSQQDLAEKLQLLGIELTSKEISKIENNARLIQDFELFAFAKIFNVSADIFNKYNSK
ncbi:MAG: helix-turn-helix transcriptional regulator [Clostridia bacterium]|nr:helix-turn-helix transcriptional regulator [Clostridia bacterium]